MVRRDPRTLGLDRSRWRLADIRAACDWLAVRSDSSLSHLLDRLQIAYRRGRDYVHSPDPHYLEKLADRDALLARVRAAGGREVLLFLDELTYYRQPTLACAYEGRGLGQPLAHRSHQANTATRVAGALNLLTGQVCAWQGSRFGLPQLVKFHLQIRQTYPAADRIWVVLDNWPIHYHPDVLVALEPQLSRWQPKLPPSWPTEASRAARRRWGDWQLPIQLVPLPTYASWLNPIEKLWRFLKQDVLHLHRQADHLPELRGAVLRFLEQFAVGSQELLRYVGLSLPN